MFLISLGALLYGSVMAWIYGNQRMVIIVWIVWLIGFFAVPLLFGSGWAFMVLQAALALSLIIRWKLDSI